jgi:stage III sporulation protein AF
MINLLKDWAINIVIAAIFAAFIEIILPSSSMKKYIKVVLGFVIIIIIINPFINILNKNIDIDKEVFANIVKEEKSDYIINKDFINQNNKQITEIYKFKLKNDIMRLVKDKSNLMVEDIFIDITDDVDDENFGNIKNIQLVVNYKNEQQRSQDKIKVQEIKVSIKNDKKIYKRVDDETTDKIKDIVSKEYQVPKDKIVIYMSN